MHKLYALTALFILVTTLAIAQNGQKQLRAIRISEVPQIDGKLNEAVWAEVPVATDFIQNSPKPGTPERHRTEVRVLYDNTALYIGAIMYDVSPDSVLRELGRRDEITNTDYFAIYLDTYFDKINAYGFTVTASGVQIDTRYSSSGQDRNWNAVWDSKVSINDNGWSVEMKIPYAAIRFSKDEQQLWGLNFKRRIRRSNEQYFWNPVVPGVSGFVNQFGIMHGLDNIKSPLRLSLTPYISSFVENYPYNQPGKQNTIQQFSGGADIKYGISESFTLDMTLVPDFNQVQSDNQVLNLSPFEVRFNENRPFFTEGTELFNKGGYFYSRRVGGTPLGYGKVEEQLTTGERIVYNPTTSRLINATKVSGRTKGGLGVGVFNATSADMYATVENEEGEQRKILTQPLTNYSVAVLDQSLRNNSYVSLINTNATRKGALYDANVTAGMFRLVNKANTRSLSGSGAVSQLYQPDKRLPDLGYAYALSTGKISGKFQYYLSHRVESDTYNPNDMGLNQRNNEVIENADLAYYIFKPIGIFNSLSSHVGATYTRLYQPFVFQSFHLYSNARATFTNFYNLSLSLGLDPVNNIDYFEPRVAGRFYQRPTSYSVSSWFETDYRKKLAFHVEGSFRDYNENNRRTYHFAFAPRYRVNNQLSFRYDFSTSMNLDNMGYVDNQDGSVIFGRRDLNTTVSTLNSSYIFTDRMSLSLRARHYWSKAVYNDYWLLNEAGLLESSEYNENKNINFNAFNVDMVFSWWFTRGSEMSIVWKNAILTDDPIITDGFLSNLNNTVQAPQRNSLSLKVLYFLDASMFKRKTEVPSNISM